MTPVLEFQAVDFSYHTLQGETLAVQNLDFQIYPGEFVAIVGPSGCGKSTILSMACGLLSPDKGSVKAFGETVFRGDLRIGYMLQKDHLFEWRDIHRNVSLGLEIRHCINDDNLQNIDQMLQGYQLKDFKNKPPSALSGGMRQRAALIRTLALKPELLLLDEPFSALDYQTRLDVCDDIAMLIKKSRKTAVMVTHDLAEAVSVGTRILVLSDRPTHLKAEFTLDFDKEMTPLERRTDSNFYTWFNRVFEEVRRHEDAR